MRKPVEPAITAMLLAACLVAPPGAARADSQDGYRLARQWCVTCHVIAPDQAGSDAARPFESIANDPNFTDQGIRAWLVDPHPPMPNLNLSGPEIDAIVAYLRSLRRE